MYHPGTGRPLCRVALYLDKGGWHPHAAIFPNSAPPLYLKLLGGPNGCSWGGLESRCLHALSGDLWGGLEVGTHPLDPGTSGEGRELGTTRLSGDLLDTFAREHKQIHKTTFLTSLRRQRGPHTCPTLLLASHIFLYPPPI